MSLLINEVTKYLDEIKINYQYTGNNDLLIENFCTLSEPKSKCITWIKKVDNYDFTNIDNDLNMLFVTNYFENKDINDNYNIIQCDNPKETYFEILNHFFVIPGVVKIEPDSIVETKNIGEKVSIGHHCYICKDVVIGNNVIIKNNVVIECPTHIGDNTIIWSGVVIGTDGFGYYKKNDGINYKVPHFGGVKIGKNVEIGANTCIDRGTLSDTIIGDNVKIDDLSIIAHNVKIEDNVMITGLVALGGSSVLKENVYVAPCSIILNQITVNKNAFISVGAVVMKDVPENAVVFGNPARILRYNNDSNDKN